MAPNAESVVVDSHLWVEYFARKENTYTEAIGRLARQGRLMQVGPVVYEVLVGPKDEGERNYLLGCLRALPLLPTREDVWLRAARLGAQAAARNNRVPTSDVLIAAHCIVHRCALFTRDAHFDVFGELKRHRL